MTEEEIQRPYLEDEDHKAIQASWKRRWSFVIPHDEQTMEWSEEQDPESWS